MPSTQRQRWTGVPPGVAWKRPGLPSEWVHVLERHPDAVEALPGYCWLDVRGRPLHVGEHELEFRNFPP
jgi:hypothetical protein